MKKTFSDIFEQDGQWLTGREIVWKMVKHCEGKGLEITLHKSGDVECNIPMPKVFDEISKNHVSIEYLVPPELVGIWTACKQRALQLYGSETLKDTFLPYIGKPICDHTAKVMAHDLTAHEERMAANRQSLSNCLAEAFGAVPQVGAFKLTLGEIEIKA